jgi:hypothetical protein
MFAPRYFAPRYYGVRYFPPSGQELTGVTDFLYKRDVDIYVSKSDNAGADSSNTTKINVKDFSYNRRAITKDVGRNTFDPTQERYVTTYIEAITPVDFSFTTYMTPITDESLATSAEEYLWQALVGTFDDIYTINEPTYAHYNFTWGGLDKKLEEITIWFNNPNRDRGNFRLDNAIIDRATISFDINEMAQITWEGRALSITSDNTLPTYTDTTDVTSCIKNKLSLLSLNMNNIDYNLALIGGQVIIDNNNVVYGRNKLGQTTIPEDHYSGNRTVKGNLEFYNKTGTAQSAELLNTLYQSLATVNYESTYAAYIIVFIGGNTAPYIRLNMGNCVITSGQQNFNEAITVNFDFTAQEKESYVYVQYTIG